MSELSDALAGFSTKELIAEIRTRNHGTDLVTVDALDKVVDGLSLAELGELRRKVSGIYEHKASLLGGLTQEELDELGKRNYLIVVKMIRERTGLGIVDAKAFLDKHKPGGK